jgi:3-deoxy-7-phosphoheptulonate synthase
MLQVGARNALNYSLLRSIGRAVAKRDTVVLLKRSLHMGTLNEFISAAEYIAAFGNPNVVLCPRGTSPALDGYRNHPDESITPLLKEKTWAPVVVDPSHSVGKASYVPACALAAVAYGADGLCIEAHVEPEPRDWRRSRSRRSPRRHDALPSGHDRPGAVKHSRFESAARWSNSQAR